MYRTVHTQYTVHCTGVLFIQSLGERVGGKGGGAVRAGVGRRGVLLILPALLSLQCRIYFCPAFLLRPVTRKEKL